MMLICFICIWLGCLKGISDKILFKPISFYASFFFFLLNIAIVFTNTFTVQYMFHSKPNAGLINV